MPTAHHSSDADIYAILEARHADPFGFLGAHRVAGRGDIGVIRAFHPEAQTLTLLVGEQSYAAQRIHDDGLFEAEVPVSVLGQRYLLDVLTYNGNHHRMADAYSFGNCLGEADMHYFAEGSHQQLYRVLGAQITTREGISGTQFAVWAPNARRVSLIADFNGWDGRVNPMRCRLESGVWEIFIPGVGEQVHYKFELIDANGALSVKSDPLAFFSQHGKETASLTWDMKRYAWGDAQWLQHRQTGNVYTQPVSIYEVHPGSWKRVPHDHDRSLSYHELAEDLIPYVKSLGFTHIELMGIAEYPFDGSWGYQVCGYYAPTSRHGNPDDFRAFVDRCHQEGIGVILDWVPGHFPKDEHGLARFDGTALYEHGDPRQGEHQDWGTLIPNYGRNEVRNFFTANALFWFDQYHIDGLRVDAVASMLYLDYSREAGEWVPNQFGGRENLEAIEFMKKLNHVCYEQHPGIMIIAEESTAYPGVSRPTSSGGLGFGFKWNMGWMNDSLRYMEHEPVHRRYHHGEATFSMLYAYDENFILVLSHDEVVHGKKSLINKMPGDRWQQFANLRMFYGWMWAHPGKKLLFMGCEFAQWSEWSHERSLDWHLFMGEEHAGMQRLVRDLNALYASRPALHEKCHEGSGFWWLDASDADASLFAFARTDGHGDTVYVVVNATPVARTAYRMGVAEHGHYRELLNTDSSIYAGTNFGNGAGLGTEDIPWQGQSQSLLLNVPPLGVVFVARA